MRNEIVNNLFLEIQRTHQSLNRLAKSMIGNDIITIFPGIPIYTSSDYGFLQSVIWLSKIYYRPGFNDLDFLVKTLCCSDFGHGEVVRTHFLSVTKLRTYLLDALNFQQDNTSEEVLQWFKKAANVTTPSTDEHWTKCIETILRDAHTFGKAIFDNLAVIETQGPGVAFVNEWKREREKLPRREDFHALIGTVATDLGMEITDFEIEVINTRYYPFWLQSLVAIARPYTLQEEGRRLVEHSLLVEKDPLLPITGVDLTEDLGVSTGISLKNALLLAWRFMLEDRTLSRSKLLALLREHINDLPSIPEKTLNRLRDLGIKPEHREFLRRVAAGQTSKEIEQNNGQGRSIPISTQNSWKALLKQKLGATTMEQVIARAKDEHLI